MIQSRKPFIRLYEAHLRRLEQIYGSNKGEDRIGEVIEQKNRVLNSSIRTKQFINGGILEVR